MQSRGIGAAARVVLAVVLATGTLLGSVSFLGTPADPAEQAAVAARDQSGKHDDKATTKSGKKQRDKKRPGGKAPKALNSARIARSNTEAVAALECPGLEKVRVGDRTYCTHGDDPQLFGAGDAGPEGEPDRARASGAAPRALCLDDGVSGPRVQILYVHEDDHSRLAELLPTFRRLASEMDTIVDQSARKTGDSLRIRFVTNAQCQVEIDSVSVPRNAMGGFDRLNQEVAKRGYDQVGRKYLMLVDAGVYCGVGTFAPNDLPETRVHDFTGYARVDRPCWDAGTMIHELGHTLGAVQYSAPHTSRGAHCIDEWDVMCYRDEPHRPKMRYLCEDGAQDFRLDCGNDDYFAAAPEPDSYLSRHWNMATSIYLTDGSGETCTDAALEPDDAYWYDYWRVPMPEFTIGDSVARAFCDEPGDTDWVVFQGQRGVSYRIETTALGPDVDTQLVLYRGLKEQRWDGMDQIATSDDRADGDVSSEIVFTAPGVGSYLVGVAEAGSRAGFDKTYTLSITVTDAPLTGDVTLSRTKAKPKRAFTATMGGVTPAATVTFWWQRNGASAKLGQTTAGDDGTASGTYRVPKGARKGVYQVEGIASDGTVGSASLKVDEAGGRNRKNKKRKHKKRKGKGKKKRQRKQPKNGPRSRDTVHSPGTGARPPAAS